MKLTHAHPQHCWQKIRPGMVKRFPPRGGPASGYYVACPGCGFYALHMDSGVSFVESAKWTTRKAQRECGRIVDVTQPETLTFIGTIRCNACKGTISVVDNEITVASKG